MCFVENVLAKDFSIFPAQFSLDLRDTAAENWNTSQILCKIRIKGRLECSFAAYFCEPKCFSALHYL